MEHIKVIALAAVLTTATGAAVHSAEQQDPMASGGYDPLARPVNPMMPGQQGAPRSGESDVDLNPELGNLPDTPGVEETFYLCSACHSVAIIKQQHISDARWNYLWNWMIEEQGMPEQDAETKATILSYLKRHFSSER